MQIDKTMIVGIGYKARQGKGEVATTIYNAYKDQYSILVVGFGDAVKEEVNAMPDQFEACLRYGIEYDFKADTSDSLCQTSHGKQSRLLQYWGNYRRQADPFYWVKKVRDKIQVAKPSVVLIPDMRYRNELAFVKASKGYTVKVTRQGFVDLSRDPNHISETDLDNVVFDAEINVLDGEIEGFLDAERDLAA